VRGQSEHTENARLQPPADVLAVAAGVCGIIAGMKTNKGLLIAHMVLAIIVAIWFAMAFLAWQLAMVGCGIGEEWAGALCQNPKGVKDWCCFACDLQSECDDAGCEWQNEYTVQWCEGNTGSRGWDDVYYETDDPNTP
jgi:hypothetical protein